MMLAFDTPIPFNTMGRRNVSNVPAQALILMNDPFVVEQAKLWSQRMSANTKRNGIAVLAMTLSIADTVGEKRSRTVMISVTLGADVSAGECAGKLAMAFRPPGTGDAPCKCGGSV